MEFHCILVEVCECTVQTEIVAYHSSSLWCYIPVTHHCLAIPWPCDWCWLPVTPHRSCDSHTCMLKNMLLRMYLHSAPLLVSSVTSCVTTPPKWQNS